MSTEGAMEIRRNHMSHILSPAMSEEETARYFLDIPEKILKLHKKSTDVLCGFRALRQAPKRAVIPVHLRDKKPIGDVKYNKRAGTERPDRLGRNIISGSAADADLTLPIYVEWLRTSTRQILALPIGQVTNDFTEE